jgi:hypothetical protein
MGTIQDARQILSGAEQSLRGLIQQGLKDQRYSDIAEIAVLADGIAGLLQGRHRNLEYGAGPTRVSSAPFVHRPLAQSAARRSVKTDYPRFERDGDRLVKVGWSKKQRSPYEHKAPRAVVVAFVRHLLGVVPDKRVFSVDDVLPVADVVNGGEVPAYQIYLALAWLRRIGAVVKKGRDGYLLYHGALTESALDSQWAALPLHAVDRVTATR